MTDSGNEITVIISDDPGSVISPGNIPDNQTKTDFPKNKTDKKTESSENSDKKIKEGSRPVRFISPRIFNNYTVSKKWHFDLFLENEYDIELYGYKIDPLDCSLKVYQDLFVFAFIKENLPKGCKMLDVGGGYSRILNYFKDDYECWNIDKLEGLGNGPTEMNMDGIKLVVDYMGNFNKELPDDYFDLVFSLSALEHVPEDDPKVFENIFKDLNRVTKENGYSLHLMDIVIKDDYIWSNKLLGYFFDHVHSVNEYIPFEELLTNPEIYVMPEKYYEDNWRESTKKSYKEFGNPLTYNILWKKSYGYLKPENSSPVDPDTTAS